MNQKILKRALPVGNGGTEMKRLKSIEAAVWPPRSFAG
jgi:hypothetical protein